jgi:hypothetical protein
MIDAEIIDVNREVLNHDSPYFYTELEYIPRIGEHLILGYAPVGVKHEVLRIEHNIGRSIQRVTIYVKRIV